MKTAIEFVSKVASIWGASLATIAAGIIVWFGMNFLNKVEAMAVDVQSIKTTIAVMQTSLSDITRRTDRIENYVER